MKNEGEQAEFTALTLTGVLLHVATLFLLSLAVQELALLISAHATEETLTLLLLDLLSSQLALLGLLFLLNSAQLLDLLFAYVPDLAHHLTAEVGGGNELVGEAQELVEEGQSCVVAVGKVDGKLDTLLRDGLVDPALMLDRPPTCFRVTHLVGLSTGWSVTIRYSKSEPACSMA